MSIFYTHRCVGLIQVKTNINEYILGFLAFPIYAFLLWLPSFRSKAIKNHCHTPFIDPTEVIEAQFKVSVHIYPI